MADSSPIKPTSEDAPDRTIYECTGCGTVTRDRAAQMALYKRAGALSCCPERNMVPVQPAKPAPAQDEREAFEAWLKSHTSGFDLSDRTVAWWTWQARASRVAELQAENERLKEVNRVQLDMAVCHRNSCVEVIESLRAELDALKAQRNQLHAAAAFFMGMATGALSEECGEWDRHETAIDSARSAQGGLHDH